MAMIISSLMGLFKESSKMVSPPNGRRTIFLICHLKKIPAIYDHTHESKLNT